MTSNEIRGLDMLSDLDGEMLRRIRLRISMRIRRKHGEDRWLDSPGSSVGAECARRLLLAPAAGAAGRHFLVSFSDDQTPIRSRRMFLSDAVYQAGID